jgi:TolB-like protein
MILPFRALLIVAGMMFSAAVDSPAYSQKTLGEGIKDLATQIATNASKEKKKKLAILPFLEPDGKHTNLATHVSEELVTDLFMIGGIDMAARIPEEKVGVSGIINPEAARLIGKVAGVDAIVDCRITDLQSYIDLNCRLIETQTGGIFAAAQTQIVKGDDVRKIMGAALPGPGGDSGQPPPPQPPGLALQQQRVGNFLFELKGCSLAGKLVICEFLITNTGEDVDATLFAHYSRFFDGEGNEYHARGTMLGSTKSDDYARARLASGIPVIAGLSFDGIPPETQRATLVELQTDRAIIQFRNVPLVRP